jgi:hypothetical protein
MLNEGHGWLGGMLLFCVGVVGLAWAEGKI